MDRRLATESAPQLLGEEAVDAGQRVGGIIRAVAALVGRVLKGVAGLGIDFGVDGLAQRLHRRHEGVNRIRRNAVVLAAEVPSTAA